MFFVWCYGDQLGVDRGQVGHDSMKMRGVADGADEACDALTRPLDAEVVDEWPQDSSARSTSDHYFVDGWLLHTSTLAASGEGPHRSIADLTRVRSVGTIRCSIDSGRRIPR